MVGLKPGFENVCNFICSPMYSAVVIREVCDFWGGGQPSHVPPFGDIKII